MTSTPSTRGDAPAPLTVAASLAAVEGMMLVLYALLEGAAVNADRVAMGVTTSLFFGAYGAGLIFCAWAMHRGRSWARSPIVLAQLIQLGVAWSFLGGSTTPVSVGLALVAALVIVGVFHPASIEYLTDEPRADSRHDS